MEADERRRIFEALVLASPEPLSVQRLVGLLPDSSARELRDDLRVLNDAYEASGRSFRIEEVAGGFQIRTLPELAPWLQRLRPQPPLRLSRAALETLAIVAYKQPVTRAELEHVRGVDVGAVLTSLLERRLVRLAGHREVPGRPMLYATSRRFLEVFGLASLSDLPTLREVEDLLQERAAAAEAAVAEADASVSVGAEASALASDEDPDEEVELDDGCEPDASGPPTTH